MDKNIGLTPLEDAGLILGSHRLPLGKRTLIMGILNVTPDSFSDGGLYDKKHIAVTRAEQMLKEGADIIDIGGESTRPGHEPVSAQEELERVMPVLEALKGNIDAPISIDTYKAEVAREALKTGVHMVNDIWGLKKDAAMADVVASFGVPVCLMHNRVVAEYANLMQDIISDLRESIDIALFAGISAEKIIIDPGIGFAKNPEENLQVMQHLEKLGTLGYPILLGTSRKSLIKRVLNLPAHERVEGTAATVAFGISRGAAIVRVHDVLAMSRVAKMTDAMVRGGVYDGR